MIELKYKKWEDISVELFYKIQNKIGYVTEYLNDVENLDANISLIALLCDRTEDEIANLPLNDFSKLVKESTFLQKMPNVKISDSYVINGKRYNVFTNLKKMTTAQYIDFQTLQKNYVKNIKYLLACFFIPEGKEYGSDYDIDEVAEDIYKHLSIVDANSVMFFFCDAISSFNKKYPILFNKADEEGDEEGDEQDEEDKDRQGDNGDKEGDDFNRKWGWINLVDEISELTRSSWEDVYKVNIYTFFNLICYHKDKNKFEKERLEQWKREH